MSLKDLQRLAEAKSLSRQMIPVAQRILGDEANLTLYMRSNYARALYVDPGATLNDRREAVNTLEDAERIARRVLGTAHPVASGIERELQKCRAALARVTD